MGSIFVPSRQRRLPTAGTWLWRAVLVAFVLFAFGLAATGSARAQDSKGTDFWLAFPGNLGNGELSLFITGDTATSGTVSIPGLSFTAPFSVTPGTVTTVGLPPSANLQNSDTIEDLGIHLTANAEVTVYGLNRIQATTDAYLGLPTDALGTDYINLGYKNVNVVNGTQFGLVATEDGTAVTITPTVTTNGHAAGSPYTINLNQGQTYLLRNTDPAPADLSGTLIQSSKPIAVFGGHQCANIPQGFFACDHIVEELPPTTAWGKNFVSMPLATRTGGDTFRILASEDATTVMLNGATVATLNRGQLYEQIISGPAQITADKPVLVMQYSNSSTFDGVTSDPFQMMIPPFEQFLAGYTVSTPASGFPTNFINVVAPNAAVGAITLDGSPIPAASFTMIGSSGFSGAQVPVALGSHTLSGPLPFGVHSYGFASFDSYGYPGGLSLSEVARVASVALAPKTATNQINTQHCVTATVKDQNGNPLPDIRVDFGVTGANPTTGFAFTNASGEAQFCYTGTNAGDDTIVGTVGTLSDTAAKTWSALVSHTLTVTKAGSGSGTVTSSPAGIDCGATCSAQFTEGTMVTLTATAAAGSTFTGWSGACTGTGTCTVTMDQDRAVTATFALAPPSVGALSPGYWKTHQAQTTALLPITLGNYTVSTFAQATAVFNNMNCGTSSQNGAAGCLAGQLLAAKLNVKNGAGTCIAPTIANADAFLVSINYVGPSGTYSLSAAQRALAIQLKDALDKYNNGLGC
jgi:IgGFc binding protein/Divergent InlB B-repeat domain/Bacterial Ig-like domain (group 1)